MKKWVRGVGRVMEKFVNFFLAHHECNAKKPFGNQLRVSRSKTDFKKRRLNFKWPKYIFINKKIYYINLF